MSAKSFLVISFVINCFIQILCRQVNNATSNQLIDVSDNSSDEELNPKYIEDDFTIMTTTEDDFLKCHCDSREECLLKCLDDDQRSFEAMFLLTASEVVLGTAIIMGLSAIVTVLLRVCSRHPFPRRNQNVQNIPDEFGRTGLRVSLTSLQQRVMSKLRDRPPRYETRHNYEHQRRERNTRIVVLNPAASLERANIPPPAYDANGDNGSLHDLPPTYSIAIEEPGGILNHSFTNDETTAANQNEAGSSCNDSRQSDIKIVPKPCDSVLHI